MHKAHFLFSHLDYFLDQAMKQKEKHYQRRRNTDH